MSRKTVILLFKSSPVVIVVTMITMVTVVTIVTVCVGNRMQAIAIGGVLELLRYSVLGKSDMFSF